MVNVDRIATDKQIFQYIIWISVKIDIDFDRYASRSELVSKIIALLCFAM